MMKKSGIWILCCSLLLVCLAACSNGGKDGGGGANGQQAGAGGGSVASGNGGGAAAGAAATPDKGTNGAAGATDAGKDNDGKTPAKGGKTTIVFQTFWPDARFDEAKKKYEALHPDVEIKLLNMPTDDAHVEADLEKFETTMNTAMLAGQGPDLLEMDKLPIDDYVQHGLLVDLNSMIDHDPTFKRDDYFSNILDHATIGGGLYGMPLSFFLQALAGDADALAKQGANIDDKTWSWSDFADSAKKLVNGVYPNVIQTMPEYMLNWLVNDNYSLFVDAASGKANFDSKAFTGMMEQVKEMAEDGVIGEDRPYFYPQQINSPGDYLTSLKGYLAPNMKLYVKPHAQDVEPGGYFQSYRTVGLNAKSKVKDQAWDFVTFMMSDEIETKPNTAGFPINRKAFAKEMEQLKADGSVPTPTEGPLKGVPVKVDETKLIGLEDYLTNAVHMTDNRPSKMETIVIDESKAFFSGQKSAEAVAKLIQNKATTLLNE